jgi:hypothetical protein
MADQGFATPALEQIAVKNKTLKFKVNLYGSTTEGSITASTTGNDGVRVWLSSQSATAPASANFAGLTSGTAPSVIGVYIDCGGTADVAGQAKRLHGVTVPVNSIRSASMTAGVVTNRGVASAIAGSTGIDSLGNIAFTISCTTLDLDAAALNHEFTVEVGFDAV